MVTITTVTSNEVVLGLHGVVDSKVRDWIWHAWTQGQLDLVVHCVIKSHNAEDPVAAIQYLARYYSESIEAKKQKVNWGDLSNSSQPNRQLHTFLKELLTGEKHRGAHDHSKSFGVISHVVIPQLLTGKLVDVVSNRRKHVNAISSSQLNLFQEPELFLNGVHLKKKYVTPRMWQGLIKEIEKEWNELGAELRKGNVLYHSRIFKKLRRHMKLFYGEHLFKILNRGILEDEYLIFLTLMTWAGILVHYNQVGNTPMFQEIFILPNNFGIGLGRLDALLVEKINGNAPTAYELLLIEKISRREFPSVGHVIKALITTFGPNLELVVRDWKFAVGDGTNGVRNTPNVIHTENVASKPSKEHERQIKRYLSTAVLSHSLLSKHHLREVERIWEAESFKIRGELVYFLPDSLPIIHRVDLLQDEIKLVFDEQVAANWKNGLERSQVRSTGSLLMNHAISLFIGNNTKSQFKRLPTQQAMKEILESVEVVTGPSAWLQELIEQNRKKIFLDEFEIIEDTGIVSKKTDDNILLMHLDTLMKKIEDGTIDVPHGTNLAGGFFIKCFVHGEKTPSMRISPSGNVWKCFGCGIGGKFHPHSIPDQLHSVVNVRSAKKSASQILKVEIPKEHQEIMSTAQAILQNTFFGSKGFSYLTSRALKANESYERGAGFADLRLYKSLLDRGFNYSDLLKYGFVGISPKIGLFSPLVELLKSKGVSVSDMKQSVKSLLELGGEMKETDGLPYPMLWNMVTYPLEIGGIINSLYGRSVDPNIDRKHAHRKLKTRDMPHGAWNMRKSIDSKARFMIASEAPIDTDSFIQWSTADAGSGLVGVNNELLFEMMLGFQGDIVTGFDWDQSKMNEKGKQTGLTGQLSTIKLARYMREHDFKYRVLDFTRGFVQAHPEIVYKDFNKFCMEHPQADKVDIMKYAIPVDENWLNV